MGESQLATKALRTLSGGEKSFVNLCFIMAVGFAANSPFHCMDEFDVRLSYTQFLMSFSVLLSLYDTSISL